MACIEKRTHDDGAVSFRVKVRVKGFPAQSATFARRTDAKIWAQQTESAIREGRHFKTVEAKRRTLADVVDRYVATVLPGKPKSQVKQTQQLGWWKAELGAYALSELTPARIAEARDRLAAAALDDEGRKRSPATVVRYLSALSHALSIAVKEWGWLDDSPMRKVSKPRESRGRVRFLSDVEREDLLKACHADTNVLLYPIVVVALSTGMRLQEILDLEWSRVDLGRGRVVLHETKNGERRGIPLTGLARELLTGLRGKTILSRFVFPSRDGTQPIDIRLPWKRALAAAKIDDFRFHDLRHSAASYLAMNGATLAEIAEVLGHRTLAMVKRYAHLSESHTTGVLTRVTAQIFVFKEKAEVSR